MEMKDTLSSVLIQKNNQMQQIHDKAKESCNGSSIDERDSISESMKAGWNERQIREQQWIRNLTNYIDDDALAETFLRNEIHACIGISKYICVRRLLRLSWKERKTLSRRFLNLPDHRIHKDGNGDASFSLESVSLPHALAQTQRLP
ncbi:hypothetical protein Tco_1378586 [Tanacetum coccineum]